MVAHAKRHERAAIVQVDADPVPATCVGGKRFARPFVIEPGNAGDGRAVSVHRNAARHGELRVAVVITRIGEGSALAGETLLPLQQDRLSR